MTAIHMEKFHLYRLGISFKKMNLDSLTNIYFDLRWSHDDEEENKLL